MKEYDSHCILICSCDKFSDTWPIINQSFEKFWPDCPYKIYIVTNHLDPKFNCIDTIKVGEDLSWSSCIHKALINVNVETIQLWLDDVFLYQKVKTEEYVDLVRLVMLKKINHLRLTDYPGYSNISDFNSNICELNKFSFYRVTIFPTIWNKKLLCSYLLTHSTPWEFETTAAFNLIDEEFFYCTKFKFFKVIHGITAGQWIPGVSLKLKKFGYQLTDLKRPRHNWWRYYLGITAIKKYIIFIIPAAHKPIVLRYKQNLWGSIKKYFK
jgi:hypothetical protein